MSRGAILRFVKQQVPTGCTLLEVLEVLEVGWLVLRCLFVVFVVPQVRNDRHKLESIELVVREYEASGGREFFISYETPCRTTICGFCRLRISDCAGCV